MFKKIKKAWIRRMQRRKLKRSGAVGKKRKGEDNAIVEAADKSRVLGIFLLFLLWAVAAILLMFPCRSQLKDKLVAGRTADKNIYAEIPFSYVSSIRTKENKEKAEENSPEFYNIDDRATEDMRARFHNFFKEIAGRHIAEQERDNAENREKVKLNYSSAAAESYSAKVASLTDEDFAFFRNLLADNGRYIKFQQELDNLIHSGIFGQDEKDNKSVGEKIVIVDLRGRQHSPRTIDDIPSVEKAAKLLSRNISDRLSTQKIIFELFGREGNLRFDAKESEDAKYAAVNKINDVLVEVKQYAPIITVNTVINEKDVEKYNAYMEKKQQFSIDAETVLRSIFTSLIMVVFVGFYIYHIHPEILRSNRKLALLGFVTIFSLLLNYAAIRLYMAGGEIFNLPQQYLLYFSPYTLASVVLAVTLGFRVALYIGFFVASLLALMNGGGFEFAFMGMVACSLSALAVRNAANYRAFFFWTLLPVGLMGFICFLPNLQSGHMIETLLAGCLISATNAFLTSIAAMLIIFFLELIFNVTTNMSLLLLINSHPLLERLKREAPGTYFHSMMVATLAEDAAKAIGANAIRAKCGALYHDIGKLSKPQYFTENNLENDNQHTDLNPQVSSIIIRDHVNKGLELAEDYKLNRIIHDAIKQHHGNDLVHYFYNIAITHENKNGSHVDEGQFRYHGDLPSEKEMVIISLADACEAAVRSLEKPNMSKIESMVDEIFKKRFRDNQLNKAQITLNELHKVRESFVNNLISMRHGRISYHKDENSGNEDENDLFVAAAGEQQGESKKTEEIY